MFNNETVLSHLAIISSKCAKLDYEQTICDLIEKIIKANNEKFVFLLRWKQMLKQGETNLVFVDLK